MAAIGSFSASSPEPVLPGVLPPPHSRLSPRTEKGRPRFSFRQELPQGLLLFRKRFYSSKCQVVFLIRGVTV